MPPVGVTVGVRVGVRVFGGVPVTVGVLVCVGVGVNVMHFGVASQGWTASSTVLHDEGHCSPVPGWVHVPAQLQQVLGGNSHGWPAPTYVQLHASCPGVGVMQGLYAKFHTSKLPQFAPVVGSWHPKLASQQAVAGNGVRVGM